MPVIDSPPAPFSLFPNETLRAATAPIAPPPSQLAFSPRPRLPRPPFPILLPLASTLGLQSHLLPTRAQQPPAPPAPATVSSSARGEGQRRETGQFTRTVPMGAEAEHPQPPSSLRPGWEPAAAPPAAAPAVLGLQLSALIDHVARVDWSLLDRVPGDRGGSQQVSIEELNHILTEVNAHILPSRNDLTPISTMAGGSVANTIRGLSAGFGISTGIIGACGDDNQAILFVDNMSFSGVDLTRLRAKKGYTAQCVCLVDASGNRTMRPCLSSAVKLQANEFRKEDFKGSKWLVVRYAQQNLEQIVEAIRIAKQEGLSVSLDLASFEMVRDSRLKLINLLETGNIDLCFANEDEARELIGGGPTSDPEEALAFIGKYCRWAVVTLASKGCMAKHGKQVVQVPAIGESNAVDTTGAGDLFASGFLYGLVKGLPLEDCCKVGACSGGSVTRALGGEVRPENWQWMYKQMHARGLLLPELKN